MEGKMSMTAKEYFTQILRLDKHINVKIEQLDYLRSMATKVTSFISDMPRSDSPNLQQLETAVIRLDCQPLVGQ